VVAIAPVSANTITNVRTMSFMVFTPFLVTQIWAVVENSLDTPDVITLRCMVS
jgi:hypothetical protein